MTTDDNRFAYDYFSRYYRCSLCSTRTTAMMVPETDRAEHEKMHAEEDAEWEALYGTTTNA